MDNNINWNNINEELINRREKIEKAWESDLETMQKSFEDSIKLSSSVEEFTKAWSTDLSKKFPNGKWITMSGAKVFVNGGKVVAGLDGFNKEIDKFFDGKKKDDKPVNERSKKEKFSDLSDKVDYYKELSPEKKKKYEDDLMSMTMDLKTRMDESKYEGTKKVYKHQLEFNDALFKKINDIKRKEELFNQQNKNKQKLSPKQEGILSHAQEQYDKADPAQKLKMWNQVKDQVDADEKGKKNIGMGLDEDMVAAGKAFLAKNKNPKETKEESKKKIQGRVEGMKNTAKDAIDKKFNVSGKHGGSVGIPLSGVKKIYTDGEYKGKKVGKLVQKDAERLLDNANDGNLKGIREIKDKYFSEWNKSKSKAGTQRDRYVPINTAKVELYNLANSMLIEGKKSIKSELEELPF